jgi:ABC-2 type transport system ATP-binding protein
VIVLDEPTAGVDVELRQTLWRFVSRLNREGHTIVLTTHYLEEAQALCKRIAMLKQGAVVALESTASLLARFDAAQLILHFARGRLPEGLLERAVEPENAAVSDRVALRLTAASDVEPILAACRANGAVVDQVSIERVDLEDVFVQIMGDARDESRPASVH